MDNKDECIACRWSGFDDDMYKAYGCPACTCVNKNISAPIKPKRTISLEAYIKMQNDWLIALESNASEGNIATTSKDVIDALLKFNGVEVAS